MLLKTYISAQLFLAVWAATVPTPTVPGIFNFTSLIDLVVNVSSPEASSSSVWNIEQGQVQKDFTKQEPACRLQEITGCFRTTAPRFYTAVINIYRRDTRRSICGIADDFYTCAVPYKQKCSSAKTLLFDIFTGLIQYLCTEQGYNDYLSLVPCVSNPEVTTEINKCVDHFPSLLRWDDLCRLPENYTSCVIDATRGYCKGTSADMLRQTLTTILYPLKIATCKNSPPPTDYTKNAVKATEIPADVSTTLNAQASIFAEPSFSLENADASSSAPAWDFISTRVFSEDLSTTAPGYLTGEDSLSSLSTLLPATQQYILETSTVLPDIDMLTQDVSTLAATFVIMQSPVDEASASLSDLSAPQPVSQDLTATPISLVPFQVYPEEVLTSASQILKEESGRIKRQELQVESVTITSEILQAESVTTASQSQSAEFSTISPDVTTQLNLELSTTEQDSRAPEEQSLILVSTVSSEDSSQAMFDIQASSLEMSSAPSYITPELSREFSTVSTSISASRSIETVSVAPIEVTTIEASPGEFSTAFPQVTAVQTALGELSTAPSEITLVQGSQGELSTAIPEATPSGLSSENLRTELPRTSNFQQVSDEVSTSQLQTSTVQTILEDSQATPVGFASSSLASEDGRVSVIVPQDTQFLSSLDEFTTAVPDYGTLGLSTESFSTSLLDIAIPAISEQFSTVPLNIETSQVTTGNIPAQTADVTVTETPVSQFATVATDIGAIGDSSGEFVTESEAAASVFSEQFYTAAPAILTSTVLSEDLSSTLVARIPSEGFSSGVPDIGITVISSELFPTANYDDRTIEAYATATPVESGSETEIPTMSLAGTTPYSDISTNLDLSTSATEIYTINDDGTTIPIRELSTIFQEISTNLPDEVSPIVSGHISSTQDLITTVTGGTTINPSLDNDLTTLIQDSSTEYTPLVEGTPLITLRDPTISPSLSEASLVTTQEFQISPTSVEYLPTATPDFTTTQTSSQATTTSPVTTSAPPTTTTSIDFKTSPLNCYECHSGAPGSWQNVNCPPDGRIQNWATAPNLCQGPCVSVVSRFPAGDVYRACSTNYYFPTPPPLDGCTRRDQGLFCFCSTHFCNTRDMTKEQKEYTKG